VSGPGRRNVAVKRDNQATEAGAGEGAPTRCAVERVVVAMRAAILPEFAPLARPVRNVSEEYAVKIPTPNRSDQPADERMRDRSMRNRLSP